MSQKIKRCFLIGPMKNMQRLLFFRDEVLKPILEPLGFRVISPDEGEIGNIMRQVLLNLEQADILVADITGNNPNVMYELGVYHCFGKPYVTFKDLDEVNGNEQTPFDIAEHRFVEVRHTQREKCIEMLSPVILDLVDKIDKRDWFGNPVTDFFQSPVAEIPTAVGLFKNYRKNFLTNIIPVIFQREETSKNYRIEVRIDDGSRDAEGKLLMKDLSPEDRRSLMVEILIPRKMVMANYTFIDDMKDMEKIDYRIAEVGRRVRPFKLHYYRNKEGRLVLCDIPTVLSTLNESIEQRRKLHQDQFDSEEWEVLEKQELERFYTKCELYKKEIEGHYPITRNRINIVWDWFIE
ncbi:MAG TPA: STING domain-containing protein [Parasegetibacter sp.]